MSDIAIKVEGLGKKYAIGQQKSRDFRNSFTNSFLSLFSKKESINYEEFWALQDISFQITQGEAIGIIGRNGAGKSTLLKILSRITEPTKGRFEINGRVSSLLEVGTGFHSELTGRENIYLNGTILGMRRIEIKNKFDEILEFSEVEKFIDTPVKHYSSGMKVRLAFSVAAHLNPEILIVDEVLAVGDAEFQKKCLGKMNEVTKQNGRTILFVSHNMGVVEALCNKGILLLNGKLASINDIKHVIHDYIGNKNFKSLSLKDKSFSGNGAVKFTNLEIFSDGDSVSYHEEVAQVLFGKNVQFRLTVKCKMVTNKNLFFAITILDQKYNKITTLDNFYINKPFKITGNYLKLYCEVEKLNLNPGVYYLDLWCSDGYETFQNIEQALYFEIIESNYLKTGKSHSALKHGYFYLDQRWEQL